MESEIIEIFDFQREMPWSTGLETPLMPTISPISRRRLRRGHEINHDGWAVQQTTAAGAREAGKQTSGTCRCGFIKTADELRSPGVRGDRQEYATITSCSIKE